MSPQIDYNETDGLYLRCDLSKKGHTVAWEDGGGMTNSGDAMVITDSNGGKKIPLVLRGRSNDKHALFVVSENDIVIDVNRAREDVVIEIYRVGADIGGNEYYHKRILHKEHCFSDGEWDIDPPEALSEAIDAAVDKTWRYHCRQAVWIGERPAKYW